MHPNTPITVVEGPLATGQLLETPLLNQLNFATLIATKAARILDAARGRPVLEFGMRRAAARGADTASRAKFRQYWARLFAGNLDDPLAVGRAVEARS